MDLSNSEQLSLKKIGQSIVLKYFVVPMLLLIAFILVVAGMIMYNRYALPLNTILIVDGIAGIVLSICACYPLWARDHEEKKVGNECPIRNYFLIPMLFFIAFVLVIIAMIMHNRYAIAWDTIIGVDAIVGIILTSCVYFPVRSSEKRFKAEYGC
jgi:succinate-acetate transporter protein